MTTALRAWGPRRWISALVATLVGIVVVAVPTALVPNPVFTRMTPPEWWAWPALVVSAALGGLLFATYVRSPAGIDGEPVDRSARRGVAGGVLTFFAVGCPVCNKLVLLALGSAGAMTWFRPFQPVLQVGAVALLAVALRTRLAGEVSCPVPAR